MDEIIKDKEKFGKIRVKSIETLQNTFLEGSVDPDIAVEILEIFSNVFNKIEDRREINGLFDYIEEELEEMKRLRSEENRGREDRSPLPLHKIVALSILTGLGIITIIICGIIAAVGGVHWFACILGAWGVTGVVYMIGLDIIKWC